jgi:DNA-binding NarL/FixJ family response regulator
MTATTEIPEFDSLELPLRRLRQTIEQAERELACLRRAYEEAARLAVESATAPRRAGHDAILSRQELWVAALIAEGRSNSQIAVALHLSVHTVKSHVQSILRKRALRSRWQLVSAPAPQTGSSPNGF